MVDQGEALNPKLHNFFLKIGILYCFQLKYFGIAAISSMYKYVFSGGSRIFPRGVRQLPKVLLFFKFFAENCMKMKEFGPQGACPWRPLDPPMVFNLILKKIPTKKKHSYQIGKFIDKANFRTS